jgi:hypothetical protein
MVIASRGEPTAWEARGSTELGLPPAFPPPRRGFAPCAAPRSDLPGCKLQPYVGMTPPLRGELGYNPVTKSPRVIDFPSCP